MHILAILNMIIFGQKLRIYICWKSPFQLWKFNYESIYQHILYPFCYCNMVSEFHSMLLNTSHIYKATYFISTNNVYIISI